MVYEKQEKHHNTQNVKKIKNMPKPEIHPTWFPDAPVLCEGKTALFYWFNKTSITS